MKVVTDNDGNDAGNSGSNDNHFDTHANLFVESDCKYVTQCIRM